MKKFFEIFKSGTRTDNNGRTVTITDADVAQAAAAYDPKLHEAISHLPSDTVPEGHVSVQTRRGYQLGEKLLRPAQVVVSSGSPEQAATAPTPEK